MSDYPEIDSGEFRKVMGHYPTGVTLVTAHNEPSDDGGGPAAMVIGSFGSVSLDPPLAMFMPTADSRSWQQIEASGNFCVNVLGQDQLDLCNSFFKKETDPWEGIDWTTGPSGSPIVPGCVAWIDCTIEQVVPAGDHLIVLGRVLALEPGGSDAGPLLFFKGGYGQFADLG